MTAAEVREIEFRKLVAQSGPHLTWFLGAGASRSSGLPTATDITWDLKRRYYCVQENQDILAHDISNKAVQARVQGYMDGKGFPRLWDPNEYSFYFELTFGKDYAAQQRYLNDVLATQKVSSTVGHRALAALLHLGLTRIIFTTNFDEVVESAYAAISGKNLTTFHLEGSYAALEALNAERFPFYAKVHGDFRYQSVKNLAGDLLENDRKIQKCLAAAATRFGMVVSGYSGRDINVMAMFREAIDQNNAFPHGLYWTVPRISRVEPAVQELMAYAQAKGVKGGIVETGTFDEMLSKIWRLIAEKNKDIDARVRSVAAKPVRIQLPDPGKGFPILRTNALLLTSFPKACGAIEYDGAVEFKALRDSTIESKPECSYAHMDRVLFWGDGEKLAKGYDANRVKSLCQLVLGDPVEVLRSSTHFKSMAEETVATALIAGKPLLLRRKDRTWYAVVDHANKDHDSFKPLRRALSWKDKAGVVHESSIQGPVRGLRDVHWGEATSIKLEERNGQIWLLLEPNVWISPMKQREEAREFLYKKRINRWNKQSYDVLSAWIQILLGRVGAADATVTAFEKTNYPAKFSISARSAFSRRIV